MRIFFILIGAALIITGILFIATDFPSTTPEITNAPKKLQVTTSFYPLYFFASRIGGSRADVYNLTPAGSEPHDYELTTKDVVRIHDSSLLILNGNGLEVWGDEIQTQLKGSDVVIITAGESLANKEFNEAGEIVKDPHIWLNPLLAKQEALAIEKGFERIDPENASFYQANMQALDAELDRLDTDFRQNLSSCQKNSFVTSHNAFSYLAEQYGIRQIAISGVSPDEEPSPQKLAEITDLVKKEGVDVIFFETTTSPKLSQTIASEIGAKTLVLDPLEGISDDDIASGKDYFTVMQENLSNLKQSLQCQ